MRNVRLQILILVSLILSLLLAGCGSGNNSDPNTVVDPAEQVLEASSADEDTEEQPPAQSDEPSVTVIQVDDDLQDALHCKTGELPADVSILSPAIDVTLVEAEQLTSWGNCFYRFEVVFGELDKITDPNSGIISFLPLDFTEQMQQGWPFPDSVGRIIFKWYYKIFENKEMRLFIQRVNEGGMGMEDLENDGYSVEVKRNRYIVKVPCDLVPEGSGWYLSIADLDELYCDLVGYSPGSAQSYELPVEGK